MDEVYKLASVTGDLNADATMVRAGANAKEIIYPQISVKGLGNYDRNSGYTSNSVKLEWKTATFDYDRGTKIAVDTQDNAESMNIAFGRAGAELMRTKVAPEADAYTFAKIAGTTGITKVSEDYASAEEFLSALLKAVTQMDEDEVPSEQRILYSTPTLLNSVKALDTYKSREALQGFAKVVPVPSTRFYTKIKLLSGADTEIDGGYTKAEDGHAINFLIVSKPAVMKWDKHTVSNVIPASNNIESDSDVLKYRKYGIVDVYANKVAGIYLSASAK